MTDTTRDFDAAVIGAGLAGLYMVKSLRDTLGMTVRGFEAGETVGGTWYWNRYPGARCDSEAYIYGCMWDRQLLRDWEWLWAQARLQSRPSRRLPSRQSN